MADKVLYEDAQTFQTPPTHWDTVGADLEDLARQLAQNYQLDRNIDEKRNGGAGHSRVVRITLALTVETTDG